MEYAKVKIEGRWVKWREIEKETEKKKNARIGENGRGREGRGRRILRGREQERWERMRKTNWGPNSQ